MEVFSWPSDNVREQARLLARPPLASSQSLKLGVAKIIAEVRSGGDQSLIALTEKLDGVKLQCLQVSEAEFAAAESKITAPARAAMENAFARISAFHRAQCRKPIVVETAPGVICEKVSRPIQSVGLYVPAGTAPLPSTALMLGVPSAIAGCPIRVLCSPPTSDGSVDPHVLAVARLCGIDLVFKLGGAQAAAAMAFGSESVPQVNKIFGPGNAWFTEAKIQAANDPMGAAFDMPAGPSEVMVLADAQANPDFVAADLLSQAEHGPDSQAMLVCLSTEFAERVNSALQQQTTTLSRAATINQSMKHSRSIVAAELREMFEIANQYAPEHLIVQIKDARQHIDKISQAGSVFLGAWTPEALGDYCSGTNHVLPTYGHAKAYSGLSTDDFLLSITIQESSVAGLQAIGPDAMTLAEIEGLDAHRNAVALRLRAAS